MKTINILAVNDPAVATYVDSKFDFIEKIEKELNCKINFDIIDFQYYYDQLMQAFKTDTYDVVMVAGHLWLAAFVKERYLEPFTINETKDYHYQDVLSSIRSEMQYKNRHYLLPSFCDGHMLLYRKSVYPNGFNKTVSLKALEKKLKELRVDQKDRKSFVLKAHPSEIFLDILPYLRANQVEPFDAAGKPMFNSDAGIKAVQQYMALLKYCPEETRIYGNEEIKKAIQTNTCDLAITWGGQLGAVMDDNCLSPEDIGFATLEKPWNVTWSFGLNSQSKQSSLAVKVMQLLTRKEIDIEVGRICGNPTRQSSFDRDSKRYAWYPAVKEMIETYEPLASVPTLPESIAIVTEELTGIVNGRVTIEEGLSRAEDAINEVLNRK